MDVSSSVGRGGDWGGLVRWHVKCRLSRGLTRTVQFPVQANCTPEVQRLWGLQRRTNKELARHEHPGTGMTRTIEINSTIESVTPRQVVRVR